MAADQLTQTRSAKLDHVRAPPANRLPAHPASWYLFCHAGEIREKPFSKPFLGRRLVSYRTAEGQAVVLDGRCSHLGTDLGLGQVVGNAIQCPFHHWEYAPDGRCTRIPAQSDIPPFARQVCFPTVERHGFVFIFNGPKPLFPLPFFGDELPEEFEPAKPFSAALECPWYMVGAHTFDRHHLWATHDRRLTGAPFVECPSPFSRRATATFGVVGTTLRDRLTRRFAGDEVTLATTDWCGTLILTTATFRRTTGYGMVAATPQETGGVRVEVVPFVKRSGSRLGRMLFDPVNASVRRYFIKKFVSDDFVRLSTVRYNPHALIGSDQDMIEYFHWLTMVAHGGSPESKKEES